MAKGVANLYRYAEVSLTPIGDTWKPWHSATPMPRATCMVPLLGMVVATAGRTADSNRAADRDMRLFKAVLRGEHCCEAFEPAKSRKSCSLNRAMRFVGVGSAHGFRGC